VVSDYVAPFAFNSTISKVHFEIRSRATKADIDAFLKTEAAKE
jgi:hypothetical protein